MSAKLAAEILQHFDSSSSKDYRRYFSASPQEGIPRRSGYYIGYLVAKRLSKQYSLPQLARLQGEALRRAVRTELQQLAKPRQ